jgi:divinyl protochlorophyllide a 8-vinyl-reductase
MIGVARALPRDERTHGEALIGPNALIQTARALEDRLGEPEARRILRMAGYASLLDAEPSGMQPEREFLALVRFLEGVLPADDARELLREAGRRTGAYVLEHRIPGIARFLVRILPTGMRTRVVLEAIARHAWTFTGSGAFAFETRPDVRLTLSLGAQAREIPCTEPLHAYYHGALETLLRALVARNVELGEAPGTSLSRRHGAEFRLLLRNPRAASRPGQAPRAGSSR